MLTKRSAIDKGLVRMMIPLANGGFSFSQFRDLLAEMNHITYDQERLIYIFNNLKRAKGLKLSLLSKFSDFSDKNGYAGKLPSLNWLIGLYVKSVENLMPFFEKALELVPLNIGRCDHSHKVSDWKCTTIRSPNTLPKSTVLHRFPLFFPLGMNLVN